MLPGFQQYLVDKGFTRTCIRHCGSDVIEDYTSTFLSSYSPIHYDFRKDDKYCWWGLSEHKKPPVMYLGNNKMRIIQNTDNYRTQEDGYRILFSQWREDRFDEMYDVFMTDGKCFEINCENEENITVNIIHL